MEKASNEPMQMDGSIEKYIDKIHWKYIQKTQLSKIGSCGEPLRPLEEKRD